MIRALDSPESNFSWFFATEDIVKLVVSFKPKVSDLFFGSSWPKGKTSTVMEESFVTFNDLAAEEKI